MIKILQKKIKQLGISTFLVLISLLPLSVYSQEDQNGSEEIQEDEDEIIIKNQLFSKINHNLTIGFGEGYYFEQSQKQSSFGADLNVTIKKHHFTAGYFYTGQRFITESYALQLNDIHVCYGWRKETRRWNRYYFIGPSLAMGFEFDEISPSGVVYDEGFIKPGIYTEYQYVYKVKYDLGIGLAAYTALSTSYQTIGLKAIIYLSTAYIGKVD